MFYDGPPLWKRILKAVLLVILSLVLGVLSCILYEFYVEYQNRPADVVDGPQIVHSEVSFESGVTYQSAIVGDMVSLCSSESISFIDKNGKKLQNYQTAISNPLLSSDGNYLLVSDKGSKEAYLFKKTKEIASFETEGSIISSSVCAAGYSVFVTKGDLHKCSVIVLSPDGEEIFKWNSGGLNVISADISDDGKEICISSVNTDDGVIKSNIIMFNTGKDKPFTNDVYEGLIFSNVLYESNYVYVIGDSAAYIYSNYGKLLGMVDFSDRELMTFKCYKNNLILAFLNSSYIKGGCLIESYNTKGEMQGRFELMNDIRFLDSQGSSIAVNSGSSLVMLDLKCRERKNVLLGEDIRDFMFMGSDSVGVGISGFGTSIIKIN